MNILDKIIKTKHEEIKKLKKEKPLNALIEESMFFSSTRKKRPFIKLFENSKKNILIAEIKPTSPSSGILIKKSLLKIADVYAKSKADVISVLTDNQYFGGDIKLLKKVQSRVHQPILRKDFIIDEYQVYETLLEGADAYLLIASILTNKRLAKLINLGKKLNLDALVEVNDENDIKKAVRAGAKIIGINNRNLKTFDVNIEKTKELIKYIPSSIPVISASGIITKKDIQYIKKCGAQGVLIGTSILQSANPAQKIDELKNNLV